MSYKIKMRDGDRRRSTYDTMLDARRDLGVFSVIDEPDGIKVLEECDMYYWVLLTPDQLRTLGQEIIARADEYAKNHP